MMKRYGLVFLYVAVCFSQTKQERILGINTALKKIIPAITHNPYKKQPATVRFGNELCDGEKAYLQKRKPIAKKALQNFVNKKIYDAPQIAVICSGGGYRALISTLGFLCGADKIGLLDCITYLSTLSGSTWAVGSWMSSGLSIQEFTEYITPILHEGLDDLDPKELKLMADALLAKFAYKQPITLVDLYGGLLATTLLQKSKKLRHRTYVSEQIKTIESGTFPFPIYTAIRANEKQQQNWFEFTPFEVGGAWLEHYVPSWAFGRKFDNGTSIDDAPEQSLGFLFGTFGSAFAATYNRIYDEMEDNLHLDLTRKVIRTILKKVGNKRISSGKVFNFTYGMKHSPIANTEKIGLVDAGIAFNLPYPPVSGMRKEREPQVLIFMDASSSDTIGDPLRKVEKYAIAMGLPFPKIDYSDLNKTVSVFGADNSKVPTVIYFPLVHDKQKWNKLKKDPKYAEYIPYLDNFDPQHCTQEGYCSTFNFEYTVEQVKQLSAVMEFNVVSNKEVLKEVIATSV